MLKRRSAIAAAAIAATLTGIATPAFAQEVTTTAEKTTPSALVQEQATYESTSSVSDAQDAQTASAEAEPTGEKNHALEASASFVGVASVADVTAAEDASPAATSDATGEEEDVAADGSAATEKPVAADTAATADMSSDADVPSTSEESEASQTAAATAPSKRARVAARANTQEAATIEEGVYYIKSNIADNRYVDVDSGSHDNGTDVQIWSKNDSGAQRWKITAAVDGFYTIQNVGSGKFLDVREGLAKSGTAVQQFEGNNTAAQMWKFVVDPARAGSYFIYSRLSGVSNMLALDVLWGDSAMGQDLQIFEKNGTAAQSFSLEAIKAVVSDGVYYITNAGSGKALDIAAGSIEDQANLQQYDVNKTQAQAFKLEFDKNTGYYTIISAVSGRVLDAQWGEDQNGTNVWQFSSNDTAAQRWIVRDNGDNTFSFFTAKTGRALDVENGSHASGANIQLFDSNGTLAQRWRLEEVTKIVGEGVWRIVTENNHNNSLGVASSSRDNSARVVTGATNDNNLSQRWYVDYDGDVVRLVNVASGKALDVRDAKTSSSVAVQQFENNGTPAQRWKLVLTKGGYTLVSALSGVYGLDVSAGQTTPGAQLQIYELNGTAAQKFHFIGADILPTSGSYTIISGAGTGNLVVDVPSATKDDAVLQLWESNNTGAQQFSIRREASGYWRIINKNSEKSVTASGQNVKQTTTQGTSSQLWQISFDPTKNALRIISKKTGQDIFASAAQSGAQLKLGSAQATQGFYLEKIGLNGVDIAMSYQGTFDPATMDTDFVIIKATEGTSLQWSDGIGEASSYTEMADRTLAANKLLGFYHFANQAPSMVEQARAFVNSVKNYVGKAIFVLDWENSTKNDVFSLGPSAAKEWLDYVFKETGVKPLIYMSRSVTTAYDWSAVANAGYGLWVAQYADSNQRDGYEEFPWEGYDNNYGAWSAPVMRQYTDHGRLSNYNGDLDFDKFYGGVDRWTTLASRS
ncbi:MAG: RICIN domain-containing protein [Atopobiaceae bacterium]